MAASAEATCDDCYFRQEGLCALRLERPCPTFRASVNSLARQISAQVAAVREHPQGFGSATGTIVASCQGTVTTQLTQRSHSLPERRATFALRTACGELIEASKQQRAGHTAAAKQLAAKALAHAQRAVAAAGGG